jgi:FAD/FMN-containing dehydrogenase
VPQVALTRLDYSYGNAAAMLDGYARWLVDAPRTIGSASFIQLLDAAPGKTPAPIIFLLSVGTSAQLASEAAWLVALTGAPASQTPVVALPYETAMMSLYGCTDLVGCHRADTTPGGTLPRQEFGLLRSRMFSSPPPIAMWEQVLTTFEDQRLPNHARQLEIWAFDGAVHDVAPAATAFVHRDSLISVSFLGSITTAAAADAAGRAAAKQFADTGFAVLDPHSSGETYQNFIDAELTDWPAAYYGQNYARLSTVKHKYDPHGAFRFAQSIH